jgi:hypothetical protein
LYFELFDCAQNKFGEKSFPVAVMLNAAERFLRWSKWQRRKPMFGTIAG